MTDRTNQVEFRLITQPRDNVILREIVIRIVNRIILKSTFNIFKNHMTQSRRQ